MSTAIRPRSSASRAQAPVAGSNAAGKLPFGGTGHDDMVVVAPFDPEAPPGTRDRDAALRAPGAGGADGDGAGGRTAGPVRPAPRSQVRMVMASRAVTCAMRDVGALGKDRMILEHRPETVEFVAPDVASTQKMACGLPIETTEGECRTGASIGPICNSIMRVSRNSSASGMSCQPKRGMPMSTEISRRHVPRR